tara:strand:+ start:12317 stop:12556 length:240 start_codon:yes stop_codon:yes gene_type:complete
MEKFNWPKIHKTESMVEDYAYGIVESNIIDYFQVEELTDITVEQMDEVIEFKDNYNEYSVLYSAFNSIIDVWTMEAEAS